MSLVDLKQALQILDAGGVIGMPTETVYGLAARIDRPQGLAKIFSTKERPFFDPLIVHVDSIAMARSLAQAWSPVAEVLAKHFWPGPLTLVVEKNNSVNDLITSGLDSVGLRMPNHPIALALIQGAGQALAAPSANRFGRTSPTDWQHVESEFSGQVPVIASEACRVGIESTVLKVEGNRLAILRPGMIGQQEISTLLAASGLAVTWVDQIQPGEAPGQMKHHYMPAVPVVAVPTSWTDQQVLSWANRNAALMPRELEGVSLNIRSQADAMGLCFRRCAELKLPEEATVAARMFYAELRRLSESGVDLLFFRQEVLLRKGEQWQAVLERLQKATSLRADP